DPADAPAVAHGLAARATLGDVDRAQDGEQRAAKGWLAVAAQRATVGRHRGDLILPGDVDPARLRLQRVAEGAQVHAPAVRRRLERAVVGRVAPVGGHLYHGEPVVVAGLAGEDHRRRQVARAWLGALVVDRSVRVQIVVAAG